MKNRLDFSSVSKIILDNRSVDGISQIDYFFRLFEAVFKQSGLRVSMPEDADVSKILNGMRNVPKDIVFFYQAPTNVLLLQQSVKLILDTLPDSVYVKEQICHLLWNDSSISEEKKRVLTSSYELTEAFVASCILFGMSRAFISKNQKISKNTFLVSDYLLDSKLPSVSRHFVGREYELEAIHQLLCKEHCLFLEGIGGIGKSELAKCYVKRYQREYTHVIYLRFRGTIKRTILELDFIDDTLEMSDEDRFRNHLRFFKYLDERSLVVLDNFDSLPEDEPMFHEFLSMQFQVLVTTRNHVGEAASYEVKEIQDLEALQKLFYSYAPFAAEDRGDVLNIIEKVYRHTLTVELAAKTLTVSCMKPAKLLNELQKEGLCLSNPNKVRLTKDFISRKDRLYQHIRLLFQLQALSDTDIHILRNMTLMPEDGISKELFHFWQGNYDYNCTNDLVEHGWIQEDTARNRLALHPFLAEVLINETQPAMSKCADILKGIFENCVLYGLDVPYYNELLNTIESIYRHIRMDDTASAALFMDTTMSYLCKYGRMEAVERILAAFRALPGFEECKRWGGIYDCYAGYVEYMKSNYQSARRIYEHGLQMLDPVNKEYADLVSNLYNNLAQAHLALMDCDRALYFIKIALQIRAEYNLPLSNDTITQQFSLAQMLAATGQREESKKILFDLLRLLEPMNSMHLMCAQIYYILAVIDVKYLPEDSLNHLKKAKQAMLDSHLHPESKKLQEIEQLIHNTEQLAKGVQSGKIKWISKNTMKPDQS